MRDGKMFVFLPSQPSHKGSRQTSQKASQPSQAAATGDEAETVAIIELQRTELNRLLRENERLQEERGRADRRIDHALEQAAQERREQAERHAEDRRRTDILLQGMQQQVDRLTAQLALPKPQERRLAQLAETEKALAKAQADVEAAQQEMGALKGGVVALLKWLEKRA